jgi:multiphosphoryl transfer protein
MTVELAGLPAAPGRAIGSAWLRPAPNGRAAAPGSADEGERVRRLLQAVADDLEGLAERVREEGHQTEAEIVATGALIAGDPELVEDAVRRAVEGTGAVRAIGDACEAMAGALEQLDQPLLRERAADVRSVARRAAELAAPRADGAMPEKPYVLLADELGPADVVRLDPALVLGIALSRGGATSHAAIVARSLAIPLVVGAGNDLLQTPAGRSVIVDGDAGLVIVDPDDQAEAGAREAMVAATRSRRRAAGDREPAVTSDGRRVLVLCNAATEAEVVAGLNAGAEGVGLLRTELPFLEAESWPTVEQHRAALAPLLGHLRGRPVAVRVLDFGGDKTPPFLRSSAGGSFLGPRGVRLLLGAPDALTAQLEALLEAARGCDLRVMIPMVARSDDVRLVRDALRAVAGYAPPPPLGAMIEVPAAAITAGAIAEESEFLSIGTNDLVQFTLAADREDPRLADLAVAHHPAVLSLVAQTVREAHRRGRRVTVCGEAAGDPIAMPLLIGLGVDGLSVGAGRVAEVRDHVRRLDSAMATRLAEEAVVSRSAAAVAALGAPLRR